MCGCSIPPAGSAPVRLCHSRALRARKNASNRHHRTREAAMRYHQYQILGRHLPTEGVPEPKVYRMKLWSTCPVRARSKFWYFLRKLKARSRPAQGCGLQPRHDGLRRRAAAGAAQAPSAPAHSPSPSRRSRRRTARSWPATRSSSRSRRCARPGGPNPRSGRRGQAGAPATPAASCGARCLDALLQRTRGGGGNGRLWQAELRSRRRPPRSVSRLRAQPPGCRRSRYPAALLGPHCMLRV